MPEFINIDHASGLHGAAASLIGGRNENQDTFLVGETPLGLLVIVCDGMGGGPAGKTASTLAAQEMLRLACEATPDMDPAEVLRAIVDGANRELLRAVDADPALRGMGTTCVALIINGGKGYIVHVGDSRCYQIRDGKAVFRTADHSLVAELVRKGTITEEQARNSNYSNVITRAIGGDTQLTPEVDIVDLRPADRFALMSDGVWGAAEESRLVAALAAEGDVPAIVEHVVTAVDAIGLENGGGHDNLTLALIELPPVMTLVTPEEMPAEAPEEAESEWQVSDEADPASSYVIQEETPLKPEEATPPSKTPAKPDSNPSQTPLEAPSSSDAGLKPADSLTPDSEDNNNSRKRRKSTGWWIFAACAAVVVMVLLISNIYLYFNPVKRSQRAQAETVQPADTILNDSISDVTRDESTDEGVDNLNKDNDRNPAVDPALARDGQDAIHSPQLTGHNANYPDALNVDNVRDLIPGSNSGGASGKYPLDYIKNIISDLQALRDEKGRQLKKDEPGFNERLEERKRKVNAIVQKLQECRRKVPEENKVIKQKITYVEKNLPKSSAANIDANHGYPTADAIKDINYYLNLLNQI